jgi:uracil-DNA glycosylase
MNHFAETLIRALKSGALMPFRTDEEREFIHAWLSSEERGVSAAQPQAASSGGAHPSSIKERIRLCNRCAGVSERKFSLGTGENGVMIILHMPSKISAYEKKLFRADSLEMMRKMMKGIGITLEQCYITNMVKCEGSAVSRPSEMFTSCEDLLRSEIESVAPRIIIVMGEMGPLGKLSRKDPSISWFTVEHPVTLIKNPDLKRGAWNTLQLIREKAGNIS